MGKRVLDVLMCYCLTVKIARFGLPSSLRFGEWGDADGGFAMVTSKNLADSKNRKNSLIKRTCISTGTYVHFLLVNMYRTYVTLWFGIITWYMVMVQAKFVSVLYY